MRNILNDNVLERMIKEAVSIYGGSFINNEKNEFIKRVVAESYIFKYRFVGAALYENILRKVEKEYLFGSYKFKFDKFLMKSWEDFNYNDKLVELLTAGLKDTLKDEMVSKIRKHTIYK